MALDPNPATQTPAPERVAEIIHEHASLGLGIVSRDGDLLYANKALGEAVFGADRQPELPLPRSDWMADLCQRGASEIAEQVPESEDLTHAILAKSFQTVPLPDSEDYLIVSSRRSERERMLQSHGLETRVMLGQLFLGVTQDLNNLLAVALGSLELIREAGGLSSESELLLGDSIGAILQSRSSIRYLLDTAKERNIGKEVVDVEAEVLVVVDMLRRWLPQGIKLRVDVSGETLHARLDSNRLHTALLNLLLNACDAARHGGTITVEVKRTLVDPPGKQWADSAVEIKVADDGRQVSSGVFVNLTRPFFTTKDKGTGLWLPMVKQFVQDNDGKLEFRRGDPLGLIVTMSFPEVEHRAAAVS